MDVPMGLKRHAISLGAGVQSTALALMAAHGEVTPMPEFAVFADTGWEPPAVYAHLQWLRSPNVLPFPVFRVSQGDIRADAIAKVNTTGQRFASIPWFTRGVDGDGMGRRQCTKEYKLRPIWRHLRELGATRADPVTLSIGISVDEAIRAKPSRLRYIVNRWPLLEARMTRRDCLAWLSRHGYPVPPRSSCVGCPYHSDAEWRAVRADPVLWADAVDVDRQIRNMPGLKAQQFMHASRVPLADVDLTTAEDRGQLSLWANECDGMCGT